MASAALGPAWSAPPASAAALDCRAFSADGYRDEILQERFDYFSTAFCSCFLTAPSAASSAGAGGGGGGGAPPPYSRTYLAVGYSTGQVKVFAVADAVHEWLGHQRSCRPALAWGAHDGAVYSMVLAGGDGEGGGGGTGRPLLVTCGDDGRVKAWPVADLLAAAAGAAGNGTAQQHRPAPA